MIIDLQTLAKALGGEISGNQLRCSGPGHSAADRSLNIKLDSGAPDGFVVHSFAGDDPIVCKDYVRSKAGLPAFEPNGNGKHHRASDDAIANALVAAVQSQRTRRPQGRVVAVFDYTEADGTLLYQVLKYDPKDFRQRRPDGKGGWIWSLNDVRRVPYRLPELLKWPDATVFVCEGEKDSDNAAALDLVSTTVASGTWTDECVNTLAGRHVYIIKDTDKNNAGDAKAARAAALLHPVASSIKIVTLPGLTGEEGSKDVTNWLHDLGHSKEELVEICDNAPYWNAGSEPKPETPEAKPAKAAAEAKCFGRAARSNPDPRH